MAEGFDRELYVYRELSRLGITQLHGVIVPKLRGSNRDFRLIAKDFVTPPYLLDFAGVRLEPPDFPDDTMAHWHASVRENFGPNAPVVYAIYHSLSEHELYYMDFRPSNLKLDGLPGLPPPDPLDDVVEG